MSVLRDAGIEPALLYAGPLKGPGIPLSESRVVIYFFLFKSVIAS